MPDAKIVGSDDFQRLHPTAGDRHRRHTAQSTIQISEGDLLALRRAHAAGIEIVLVTGRRQRLPCRLHSNLVLICG